MLFLLTNISVYCIIILNLKSLDKVDFESKHSSVYSVLKFEFLVFS